MSSTITMDSNAATDMQVDIDAPRNHNPLDQQMENLNLKDSGPSDVGSTTESTTAASAPQATFEVDPETLALDMQQRCRLLLDELEQFQAYLRERKKANNVELRTFKSGLQAEMKLIDKVISKPILSSAHGADYYSSLQNRNPPIIRRSTP